MGCIAYVGISYLTQVLQNGLGYAALRNGHKQYVLPTQQTIAAEAAGFRQEDAGQRDDLAHLRQHQQRLPDRQLRVRHRVRHSQSSSATAKNIRSVLEWALNTKYGTSTTYLSQVNFQPLPSKVVAQSIKQILGIK